MHINIPSHASMLRQVRGIQAPPRRIMRDRRVRRQNRQSWRKDAD